jgi:hypothetical protein
VPPAPRGRRTPGLRRAGLGAAALLALCVVGQTGRAAEEWVEEEPRWIPSLRFGFDTFQYGVKSSVQNDFNPPRNSGTDDSANQLFQFQLGGELMGPIFEGLPGHPRLFAQAGTQFKPFSSDRVFDVGVGGDTELDINDYRITLATAKALFPNNPMNWPPVPDAFEGEGSEIDAEFQDFSWHAALGVAFTFPLADALLLELKPSVAYNIDRIDMSGKITTVFDTGDTELLLVERPPAGPAGDSFQSVPIFEVHRGNASERITQHSLGPGFELGLVLFRSVRPVRVSLYADVRFLWVLGDRTTEFSDSLATYEVERDPFGIRGGAGLRFSWVGFGAR